MAEMSLALSLIAAQKLNTPETLNYVREQEAMYLTKRFGMRVIRPRRKVRRVR